MARRKKESGLDEFVHILVAVPWWVGPICAALAFVLFRFVFPAVLGATNGSVPNNAGAKMFGETLGRVSVMLAPFAALFVLLAWGMAELTKFRDRRRLDGQTGLESIRSLPWDEFEQLVTEAFRRRGYKVEHTGDAAGDGGVDVILWRNGEKTLVQCKQWRTWSVGVNAVRELLGAMTHEEADYGIVVASGGFTRDATEVAEKNRITLIGGDELAEMIRSVQQASRPMLEPQPTVARGDDRPSPRDSRVPQGAPVCPVCGSAMVKKMARRGTNAGGEFWSCSRFPSCRGAREL